MIYSSVEDLIGNTPMTELCKYEKKHMLYASIYAKLEFFNPGGSVKDRAAKYMITDAEKRGLINKDTVIIEPTSGNTGIGLCLVAATRGYKCIIVMPENMSVERIKLMKGFGAEVVLTEAARGMSGSIEKAKELAARCPNSFIPQQFENPANSLAHYETTGPEIWKQTDGNVDIFIAGVGSAGTVSGCGKYLKEQNPDVKIYAAEPYSSPLLSQGRAGAHKIQGIGANFIPSVLDRFAYDEVLTVKDEDALNTARELAVCEGILCGISSGAAVSAAKELAEKEENKGKKIVVLLPDTGERYLSTELFDF